MRRQRSKRSKRHRYISEGTLKSLQKLSYQDLKNLSSEELNKYKRRVGIIQQEQAPEPYTDEELIRMLRKYISGKKGFTTRRDIKRKSRRGGGKKSKKHYGIKNKNSKKGGGKKTKRKKSKKQYGIKK